MSIYLLDSRPELTWPHQVRNKPIHWPLRLVFAWSLTAVIASIYLGAVANIFPGLIELFACLMSIYAVPIVVATWMAAASGNPP